MKKKILLGLALSLSMTTVAFASPLNNYDSGKVAVEIGANVAPAMVVKAEGSSVDENVKKKIYGGATVGLGNNLALQYDYRDNRISNSGAEINFKTQQYNLRYKLNDNSSAYLGQLHGRLGAKFAGLDREFTKNEMVVGITAQKSLGTNVTGWIGAGFGSHVQQYEAGVAYAMTKNADFDISYRYLKMNDINVNGHDFETTGKGLYTGVTFKF